MSELAHMTNENRLEMYSLILLLPFDGPKAHPTGTIRNIPPKYDILRTLFIQRDVSVAESIHLRHARRNSNTMVSGTTTRRRLTQTLVDATHTVRGTRPNNLLQIPSPGDMHCTPLLSLMRRYPLVLPLIGLLRPSSFQYT